MPWIRTIQLNKEKYSFRFSNPQGALTKCTVISGAGTITLYEITTSGAAEQKVQVGDSQFLSLDPGSIFYVALNTAKEKSNWEIAFRGKGSFELELPSRLLSPDKKGRKKKLDAKKYDRHGTRKQTPV